MSLRLPRCFIGIGSLVFSKFWHYVRNCRIFKATISLEQNDEKAWFFLFFPWYKFMKFKIRLKTFWVCVVKNRFVNYDYGTLKPIACQEWIIEWNDFLHPDTNSVKIKVNSVILGGCGQKRVQSLSSWNSKTCSISRVNRWIPDIGVSMAILNPVKNFCRWCKLNFGLLRGHVNVGLSSSKKIIKLMKNTFYFIYKALFVLEIFKFLSWHFGRVKETAYLKR